MVSMVYFKAYLLYNNFSGEKKFVRSFFGRIYGLTIWFRFYLTFSRNLVLLWVLLSIFYRTGLPLILFREFFQYKSAQGRGESMS